MYTIQALWTAAHHRVGAKFVILNNGAYQLLRLNIQQYWKDLGLPENPFPESFALGDPDLQFHDLAQGDGRRLRADRDARTRSARRSTGRSPTTVRS